MPLNCRWQDRRSGRQQPVISEYCILTVIQCLIPLHGAAIGYQYAKFCPRLSCPRLLVSLLVRLILLFITSSSVLNNTSACMTFQILNELGWITRRDVECWTFSLSIGALACYAQQGDKKPSSDGSSNLIMGWFLSSSEALGINPAVCRTISTNFCQWCTREYMSMKMKCCLSMMS